MQKIYNDVLGRTAKVEVLNWDGSVYATTSNTYNTRDQVTLVRQYQGADTSGTYQNTAITYDGYGRLKTKHLPEQNVGTATVYVYNADDTVQSVTDARGAAATYAYNNRHLVTGITYSAPSGIPATPNVSFTYDSAGNRTSMTDGMGSKSYSYNQLSQMTSETRTFTGLSGSFTLSYAYNLAGELTSITDPFNATINYAHDSVGRVSAITGVNYSVSQFISSVAYRGSGAPKQVTYGNGRTLSITHNSRLEVTHFEIPGVMAVDYQFNNDGRLSYSHNLLDNRFDRGYTYDHEARLTNAYSGPEARGEADTTNRPYSENLSYDEFDHLTVHGTRHWSKLPGYFASGSYSNNRRTNWTYDTDGNLINDLTHQYTYDAAGRMTFVGASNLGQYFDGDGQRVKSTEPSVGTYYVRSTVLAGKVIADLDSSGNKQMGYVYLGGHVLAEQYQNGFVGFVHSDAAGVSIRKTHSVYGNTYDFSELDPLNADVGTDDPYPAEPNYHGRGEGGPLFPGFGNVTDPGTGCTLDGVYAPCDWITRGLESGSLALQIALGGKTKQIPIDNPGLGIYRTWVDSNGQRPASESRQQLDVGEGDVLRINSYAPSGHWVFITFDVPQNTGVKAPLSGNDATRYTNERLGALGRLAFSPGCREFLASHGVDVRALMYAVRNQRPFDGTRSTLTGADAGVVDPNNPNDVLYNSNRQIRDRFGSGSGTNAMTGMYPGGTFGNVGSGIYDRSDVYFRSAGISTATILHEALHTLLAETDSQLQTRFGLNTNELSDNITQRLRQAGCAE